MPRTGITYFDVAGAATKLMEQNIRPSIEAVRRELGTGSNSTINNYLKEWREKQGNQIELEQGIPESLLISIKSIYASIKEEADNRVSKIKDEVQQESIELQTQLSEIKRCNNQLEQNKHTLESTLNQSQEEKNSLQRRLYELTHELDKKNNETQSLQKQLNDKDLEINRVIQQLKHAQDNLEHYRENVRKEREAETTKFENRLNLLEKEVRQYQGSSLVLKEEIAKLSEKNKSLEQDKANNKQLQQQCNEHLIQIQSLKSDINSLNKKQETLIKENDTLIKNSWVDKTNNHAFQLKLEKAEGQIEAINTALKKAEDNVKCFSDKNMTLTQKNTELTVQLQQVLDTLRKNNKQLK